MDFLVHELSGDDDLVEDRHTAPHQPCVPALQSDATSQKKLWKNSLFQLTNLKFRVLDPIFM